MDNKFGLKSYKKLSDRKLIFFYLKCLKKSNIHTIVLDMFQENECFQSTKFNVKIVMKFLKQINLKNRVVQNVDLKFNLIHLYQNKLKKKIKYQNFNCS